MERSRRKEAMVRGRREARKEQEDKGMVLTSQMEQNIKRNVILGPDHFLVRALWQQW